MYVAGKQIVWIKAMIAETNLSPTDYAVSMATDSTTTLKAISRTRVSMLAFTPLTFGCSWIVAVLPATRFSVPGTLLIFSPSKQRRESSSKCVGCSMKALILPSSKISGESFSD